MLLFINRALAPRSYSSVSSFPPLSIFSSNYRGGLLLVLLLSLVLAIGLVS